MGNFQIEIPTSEFRASPLAISSPWNSTAPTPSPPPRFQSSRAGVPGLRRMVGLVSQSSFRPIDKQNALILIIRAYSPAPVELCSGSLQSSTGAVVDLCIATDFCHIRTEPDSRETRSWRPGRNFARTNSPLSPAARAMPRLMPLRRRSANRGNPRPEHPASIAKPRGRVL